MIAYPLISVILAFFQREATVAQNGYTFLMFLGHVPHALYIMNARQ